MHGFLEARCATASIPDEQDSACKLLDKNQFTSIEMKGGHHFSGDYEKLANTILSHAR